jgi:DNA-binding MarR family transcriptional regulator
MIKQIALLEAKGLIGREVSKANKRLLELSLTAAGAAALKQLRKDTHALEAELLSPLDGEEQAELRGYLFRLLDSLTAPGAQDEAEEVEEFTEEYSRAGVQRL